MFFLKACLGAIFFSFRSGNYCSRKEKVVCIPCPQLCPGTLQQCNITYSFCPEQCENEIQGRDCPDVCNDNCRDGKCAYTNGMIDLKCKGCIPEFRGQMCMELCPLGCYECQQDNSTCIKCVNENHILPNCSEPDVTTSISTSLDSDFTSSTCSSICISCNESTGDCIECPTGRYGIKCQHKCNETLCNEYEICPECINGSSMSFNDTGLNILKESNENCSPVIPDVTTITGVSIAVFLAISLVCFWYQFNLRYRLKCTLEARESRSLCGNTDPRSDGSVTTYGYAYINDRDIEQNRSDLRPYPCLGNNLYESVGNRDVLREPDVESTSSVFTLTGSVLRNLFEISNECDENNDGYEMKYLTPTASYYANNT